MIFGKYHIVIFKERSGASRSLKMRGWLGVLACLLFALLVGANIWLWTNYREARYMQARLVKMENEQDERQNEMKNLVNELASVRGDLQRVQAFDTKLRIMMDMESVESEIAMGGAAEDLMLGYLPLHRQELASRRIRSFLRDLSEEVRLEEVQQQELLLAMRDNRERLAVIPSIWPTEGLVTSPFGPRRSPFTGRIQHHKGLDISARMGTPIYSPAKGVITAAGTDGAYGISVEIKHGGGISTKYGHMQKFVVKVGQAVERGEIIGYVGRTGRVTGPHLHYEVLLNGVPTDPYAYILN